MNASQMCHDLPGEPVGYDMNTPDCDSQGEIDFSKDFFGKPAYLTCSGQLAGETYASAMGDIYTFGPTFRAENSQTTKHLAEFWMIEPELAFTDLQVQFLVCCVYVHIYSLKQTHIFCAQMPCARA
jgi:aspartyl/asparaginyl-tRNA synthetase